MNETIAYYDENKESFVARTLPADMRDIQEAFLSYLPAHASILDLGCGSGRDSRTFLKAGHSVEAVDGSPAMCAAASELTGLCVRRLTFEELDYTAQFDGVWACASLLHIPYEKMGGILPKIASSLKPGGIFYMSAKYGDFAGLRGERFFQDYTEESIRALLQDTPYSIEKVWQSRDMRIPESERFINVLARLRK